MRYNRKILASAFAAVFGTAVGFYRAFAVSPQSPGVFYYFLLALPAALFSAFALLQGSRKAPETHKGTTIFKTAVVTSSLLLILSAIGDLIGFINSGSDLLSASSVALNLICALGMVGSISSKSESSGVFMTLPVFSAGVFLLMVYKTYASACPNRNLFATELLACALICAATYSAASMRFLNRSRSFTITFSMLTALSFSCCTAISGILGMPSGKFIFSLPHLAALASYCIYSLSWYLFPPTAEPVMESSGEPEEMPIPHNLYNAEEDMPTDSRVDEIIREIKEENPKSENDGK